MSYRLLAFIFLAGFARFATKDVSWAVPTATDGGAERACIPVFSRPRSERKAISAIIIDERLRGLGFVAENRNGDPRLCAPAFHAITSGEVTLHYDDGTEETVHHMRAIID